LVSPQARQMGADAIYATNENRRYGLASGETTCFVPKGKQGREAEQKAQMRTVLGRVRGTRLVSPQARRHRETALFTR